MSRESLVLLLGVVVFFTPNLGIPDDWKGYVLSGVGLLLIVLGYFLRRSAYIRSIDSGTGLRQTDSFVESAKKETDTEVSNL